MHCCNYQSYNTDCLWCEKVAGHFHSILIVQCRAIKCVCICFLNSEFPVNVSLWELGEGISHEHKHTHMLWQRKRKQGGGVLDLRICCIQEIKKDTTVQHVWLNFSPSVSSSQIGSAESAADQGDFWTHGLHTSLSLWMNAYMLYPTSAAQGHEREHSEMFTCRQERKEAS